MSTRDLIDAIELGDSVGIQQTFETEIASRIADRLDSMRQDVAANMFSSESVAEEVVVEDAEQIDELSKSTLGSYAAQAGGQAMTHHLAATNAKDAETVQKHSVKTLKRLSGAAKATQRMAKEDTDLGNS